MSLPEHWIEVVPQSWDDEEPFALFFYCRHDPEKTLEGCHTSVHPCTIVMAAPIAYTRVDGFSVGYGQRAIWGCGVEYEIEQVGLQEMLDPDWKPTEPGIYPVRLATDGWGEDFRSWLELDT